MYKEKNITEIADKIEQSFLEESRKDENKTYPWQELPVFRSVCEQIASSLVSQNVRIIPDGSVIVRKEELQSDSRNIFMTKAVFDAFIERAKKDTAKEYHDKMAKVFYERDYVEGYAKIGLDEENDEILKDFGI